MAWSDPRYPRPSMPTQGLPRLEPAAQLVAPAGRHGARGATLVEGARPAPRASSTSRWRSSPWRAARRNSQHAEREREDRPLDHHDRAGDDLVGRRRRRRRRRAAGRPTRRRWPGSCRRAGPRRCSRAARGCRTTPASAAGRAAPSTCSRRSPMNSMCWSAWTSSWFDRRLVRAGQVPDREVDGPESANARPGCARWRSGPSIGLRSSGASSGPVRPSTSSSAPMSATSRCSAMCAEKRSSRERGRAARRGRPAMSARPAYQHATRQPGTGRPCSRSVRARSAYMTPNATAADSCRS